MTQEEIQNFVDELNGQLTETHISWVILTDEFAYKIKKPLKFSFLDFSTLEKRIHFCLEEYRLNNRLSGIYQGVVYIVRKNGRFNFNDHINSDSLEVAVKMSRMADKNRLDNLLSNNFVSTQAIKSLAEMIAHFHKMADPIYQKDDILFVEKRYKDVLQVRAWIAANMGAEFAEIIDQSINYHDEFLKNHYSFFDERVKRGFKRDLHGDLHTQNIFIADEPIVFDCIEFNKLYREIDVLNEVAFLCMDLEVRDHWDLSKTFLNEYLDHFDCLQSNDDQILFDYYKCYRANVKVKVTGLRAMQDQSGDVLKYNKSIERYIALLRKYMNV